MKLTKYFILLTLFLFFTSSVFAQHRSKRRGSPIKWLSLSVKVGGGNSILYNADIQKNTDLSLEVFSPSYFFGSRFTISIGDNIGFGAEGLYSGFGQKYSIISGGSAYSKTLKFTSIDALLFFRYTSDYGGYFEIGPKFTFLKSAKLTNSIAAKEFVVVDNLVDKFAKSTNSAMIGAGFSLFRTERVAGQLGARLIYTFSDFTPDKSFSVVNDGLYQPVTPINSSTNPFSVQAVFEISYFFGFWGDASCGRGNIQFFK